MVQRRVFELCLQLGRPLMTGAGRLEQRRVFLVQVQDEGFMGWGEASPLRNWGSESEEECRAALTRWALNGVLPVSPSSRFAVDMALGDLSARQQGKGVWEFLGGKRRRIALQFAVGVMDLNSTMTAIDEAFARGFRTVKLKVGVFDYADDLQRVRAIAGHFPDVSMRLDANGAWHFDGAVRMIDELKGFKVDYLEQPLRPEDVEGLRALRGLGLPIAADESANHPKLRARLLQLRACDVVVLKPAVLGGVDTIGNVVSSFREAGVEVMFSSAIESAVGRMAVAHLASAMDTQEPSGLNTADWLKDDVADWPLRGAEVDLSGEGLGVEVDADRLRDSMIAESVRP